VADVYQGNELWDLSLVDPDNRRPVDYGLRTRLLRGLADERDLARELLEQREDGRIKLWVTHRLLCLRLEMAALFVGGNSWAATTRHCGLVERRTSGSMWRRSRAMLKGARW
jgi:maltooligosyltrehalose synthase